MSRKDERIIYFEDNFAIRIFGSNDTAPKIFCFPYIGGNSSHFRPLNSCLSEDFQVIAVDPPGHGKAGGAFLRNIDDMVCLYMRHLQPLFQGEFYLLGHSLGGLVAYLITKCLEDNNLTLPVGLFISAAYPPHVIQEHTDKFKSLTNVATLEKALEEIGEFNMFTKRNKLLLTSYMPMIYADYDALFSCRLKESKKVNTRMYIFYSGEDEFVEPEAVEMWTSYADNAKKFLVEGRHNYIYSHSLRIAEIIKEVTEIDRYK